MEMVSASKMRSAQAKALASRHYSRKLDEILTKLSGYINTDYHPLLQSQTTHQKHALIIVSTDRGLTGSLNTNLFKSILTFQEQTQADIYTIGRQARDFTIKSAFNLVAEFGEVGDDINYDTAVPIAGLLIKEFLSGTYSHISLAYMDFISTLTQAPRIIDLLPVHKSFDQDDKPGTSAKDYTFEPGPSQILDSLLPYFIELTIYQSLLEARASEHSARMVAMKNASDNAGDLASGLGLQYNRSRQAAITSELSDIVIASMTVGGSQ